MIDRKIIFLFFLTSLEAETNCAHSLGICLAGYVSQDLAHIFDLLMGSAIIMELFLLCLTPRSDSKFLIICLREFSLIEERNLLDFLPDFCFRSFQYNFIRILAFRFRSWIHLKNDSRRKIWVPSYWTGCFQSAGNYVRCRFCLLDTTSGKNCRWIFLFETLFLSGRFIEFDKMLKLNERSSIRNSANNKSK